MTCTACGDLADYVITTGTETVHVCAAEFMDFVEAALGMGEPFVSVRRPAAYLEKP